MRGNRTLARIPWRLLRRKDRSARVPELRSGAQDAMLNMQLRVLTLLWIVPDNEASLQADLLETAQADADYIGDDGAVGSIEGR